MIYWKLSTLLWLLGVIVTLIFLELFPDYLYAENFTQLDSLDYDLDFYAIFRNNIKVCITGIFGALTFGILTGINLIYNGVVFGYLIKFIYTVNPKYYLNLLPHFPEVIGFILSSAIGFEIGYYLFNFIYSQQKNNINMVRIKRYCVISFILILFSAFSEVYISPKL